MLRQQGTGLPLLKNAMNHLPLIRKSFCTKESLRKAKFVLASKRTQTNPAELNSRLIEKKAKTRKLHKLELFLASRSNHSSSAELNSRLATRAAKARRLHEAQMISMIK